MTPESAIASSAPGKTPLTCVCAIASGFQALNRKGIELFAGDYPNDYPEVEATVLVFKHRLRLAEVPVQMRDREHGESSITVLRSVYYMLKVTLALLVAMVRKTTVPADEGSRA